MASGEYYDWGRLFEPENGGTRHFQPRKTGRYHPLAEFGKHFKILRLERESSVLGNSAVGSLVFSFVNKRLSKNSGCGLNLRIKLLNQIIRKPA